MAEMHRFSATYLADASQRLFEAAGTPADIAQRVADHLVRANLAGHDSHGVLRIPAYLKQIDEKVLIPDVRPQVAHETVSTALIDARLGWGHYAAWQAMERAMQKARETGVGAISIARCHHIGRLGEYVEQAARSGCAGIVTIGLAGRGVGGAAPFGGRNRMLGTNPWAFGMPTGDETPVVVDLATTVVAEGKIQVARSKGTSLPAGSILDKEGKPSTNPADYYAGGTILYAGGHKGYAIGLMAALFGGLCGSAEPWARHFRVPDDGSMLAGVFLLALDVEKFQPRGEYEAKVRAVAKALKSADPAPGFSEVLVPGEPEARSRLIRQSQGIDVPDTVWSQIREAAGRLNVALG